MKFNTKIVLLLALVASGFCESVVAQTLRLREQGSNSRRVSVQVGQTITVEVFGELTGVEAAGFSLFVTVPENAFQVVDQRPPDSDGAQIGVQPFIQGPLFQGAGEQANALIPETESIASTFVGQQLEYAVVIGGAGNRVRTGSGVLATFQLLCIQPIDNGQINIEDNAVLETRLVLSDGISERRFITTQGMEISVTGLELRDIPDVILLPGQADSTQIGRLSDYVQATRPSVSADSIEWSFEPSDLDSLIIEVDPVTKAVIITPLEGWSGRQRIVWTATEPASAVRPGAPILFATEITEIVVNNPPMFLVERGPDRVRRDTVSFLEDAYSFLPETTPNSRKAFNYGDLDLIIEDPDVIDPQDELRFAVLSFGGFNRDVQLSATVVGETHELLIWSVRDFTGVDSLRVLATDGLRGGTDTLIVVVEVAPVPDPPIFTLDVEERQPKITRGGTKTYLLPDIVNDVDTPVDSLVFSWIDDPGGNFTVDTTRTGNGLEISIKGKADFSGDGRISFYVITSEGLDDTMALFFTSSEALPPSLIQNEIKITISPGGDPQREQLDGFVNDPDNTHDELQWIVPPGSNSDIGIDEVRELSVGAPLKFIGYEEVLLTVSDPGGQGDQLKLRIYSSDGDPVSGGLPDFIFDRGETDRSIDLDSYYHDSDNSDNEMFWERLNTFDQNNLEVDIDPITHGITLFVPETAAFGTETVVFRVTSPEGTSANDTMLVTIRSGGGGSPSDDFNLRAFPEDIQVPVGAITEVLNLNDFVLASGDFSIESLAWRVEIMSGNNSIPSIREDNTVAVFGFSSGTDTLLFTAQDSLGRAQSSTAVVRVVGENEVLRLLSIPDIQFIAQQNFNDLQLNDFIEDKVTHPDSVISWTYEPIGDQGSLFVRVNTDNTVFATAADTLETLGVFVARNSEVGIVGRDTVRVIALDPSLANRQLQEFPSVVFSVGSADSTVALDEFLPVEFLSADGTALQANWMVSGQSITRPVIDTQAPHLLRIESIGERVGVDSLTLTADIGGGFRATGTMAVTVIEAVDESTLDLQVVPNPLDASFIDIFVIARRELAGTPNVIRSFETIDSTVAVRQIEEDLEGRGVLIWTGGIQLRAGASGIVNFEAQAFTALGTNVGDTASVKIAAVVAGKRAVLAHGGAGIDLAADAVAGGTMVLLQVADGQAAAESENAELSLVHTVDIYPLGMRLDRPGHLAWDGTRQAGEGIYKYENGAWRYLGASGQKVELTQLGRYGILRDELPPELTIVALPGAEQSELVGEAVDLGSGIDDTALRLWVNDEEASLTFDGETFRWQVPEKLAGVAYRLEIKVQDRAGNERVQRLAVGGFVLPQRAQLQANFPNPFNPETTIPMLVAAGQGPVRLLIYNAAGQQVRVLLDRPLSAGHHKIYWDGRDQAGRKMGSGVYLYRMETNTVAQTRSMTLLK
ncbi:MAG: hypothetical protein HOL51_27990 [Gemmatimonadetes bacterium]|nr:hypothetical protein [Gemmatimonadota bacterium]MBT5329961.1 hypothetical protein [Gemmatimonadota bacterium]MBT5803004.1 hypothetical protein [Gemmatimonadota bacterium]MBT6904862.1 hypothetical protein [Gemmatimonadota bacterium]